VTGSSSLKGEAAFIKLIFAKNELDAGNTDVPDESDAI